MPWTEEKSLVCYFSISKAIDSINHKIFLPKSYLSDRRQCVYINGEVSGTHPVDLGVPQGSILGPLLLNVYINNLSNAVTKSELILSADCAVLVSTELKPWELNDDL